MFFLKKQTINYRYLVSNDLVVKVDSSVKTLSYLSPPNTYSLDSWKMTTSPFDLFASNQPWCRTYRIGRTPVWLVSSLNDTSR